MQSVGAEMGYSETAFVKPAAGAARFDLRWFSPTKEVPLCGHATLASAFVVLNHLEPGRDKVVFHTLAGPLTVTRDGDRLTVDAVLESCTRRGDRVLVDGRALDEEDVQPLVAPAGEQHLEHLGIGLDRQVLPLHRRVQVGMDAVHHVRRVIEAVAGQQRKDNFLGIAEWSGEDHGLRSPLVRQHLLHHARLCDALQVYAGLETLTGVPDKPIHVEYNSSNLQRQLLHALGEDAAVLVGPLVEEGRLGAVLPGELGLPDRRPLALAVVAHVARPAVDGREPHAGVARAAAAAGMSSPQMVSRIAELALQREHEGGSAEQERMRADRLAAQLRAAGLEPGYCGSTARAIPRSVSFTVPSSPTITFPGLTSR